MGMTIFMMVDKFVISLQRFNDFITAFSSKKHSTLAVEFKDDLKYAT